MAFKEMDIHTLTFNPFDKISKQWMLITAGDRDQSNTMTASWGVVGFLWGKPVVTAYIRPQRYTKEFVDQEDRFTISFLSENFSDALQVCGSVSGRDVENKWEKAGLHPFSVYEGTPDETAAVQEAEMVFVCRKLYVQEFYPECFVDTECDEKWYPQKDYHTMYVGEIEKVLVKE